MSRPTEAPGHVVVPRLAPEAAAALLTAPRLPAGAAARVALAERAAAVAIPVLISTPAGAAPLRLARALHARGGRAGPLVVASGRRPALDHLPDGATLYLDLATLARDALPAVEAVIDDARVWVLATTAPGTTPPGALAIRLRPVVLDVPPLAARRAELPALAAAIVADLAARARRPAPAIAPDAAAHLARRPWPGDVLELEAVIARAYLVAAGDAIEARHLEDEQTAAARSAPEDAVTRASAELEFLLAELAHELRNPMVTIKTFARHLPDLLQDAELRERFERLTNEAIERMDGLLDNVITFARLGPPHPSSVDAAPLIERAIAEVTPELAGRAIHVRASTPTATRFAADPEQLTYALRNLLTGVVREVPPAHEVQVDAGANGVLTLRFAAGGEAAERLRRLTGGDEAGALGDPTLLPLSFRLARAVIERNGGSLAIVPEVPDATTVVIRLPTGNEAIAE